MTYRFYRAPSETVTLPRPSTRNKLAAYIPSASDPSATFWDVGNLCRPAFYALAQAEPATHAEIDGDTTITALSPELSDLAAVNSWLDQRAKPLSADHANLFFADAFPMTWLRDDHTRRGMFRHIFKVWKLRAYAVGDEGDFAHSKRLFEAALDATFGGLTAAQRNGARQWLEKGVGVDTTSIIGSGTTVEQAVNYIANNWIGLEPVSLGEIKF